jgi:hypothetical protein
MRQRRAAKPPKADWAWPARRSDGRADGLDLLDVPLAFTQRPILGLNDFVSQAGDRGARLISAHLEVLDREGALVPMFRARRSMTGIDAAIRRAEPGSWPRITPWVFADEGSGLRIDRDDGLLEPGRSSTFVPHADFWERIDGVPVQVHEALYAGHQLLDLVDAMESFPSFGKLEGERSAFDVSRVNAAVRDAPRRLELAVLLSALDTRYLPRITDHVNTFGKRGPIDWYGADASFDAPAALAWTGWPPEELLSAAEGLLQRAWFGDPLREWADLVRHVRPDQWARLRGDARHAVELRMAAEQILLFLEDLHAVGAAPPLPESPRFDRGRLDGRIKGERKELDGVLVDYGLSPHPAVLLVAEGETEMAILPLVMRELGIPTGDADIRLVNAHTENAAHAHALLVRFATVPRLGPVEDGFAELLRPPTHYLIAVDADSTFRSSEARDKERDHWADEIMRELPKEYRTNAARADVAALVHVATWADGLDFERSNFTDLELATALLATGRAPAGTTVDDLHAMLSRQRADLLRGHPRKLGAVWAEWASKPSKPQLALALWPVLRRRIRRKRSRRGLDTIPAARIALQASDLLRRRNQTTGPRRTLGIHV